jgi:hypothetical protein
MERFKPIEKYLRSQGAKKAKELPVDEFEAK